MNPNYLIRDRPAIYGIRNLVNGKVYVGKAKCIYRRCHQYVSAFTKQDGRQINNYLLASMNKHGLDSFEMFPLEFVREDRLQTKELSWIKNLQTCDRNFGYNLRMDSSNGMLTSKSTSQKISARLKKEWRSGIRDGHSEKLKAVWAASPEKRERQGLLFTKIKTKYRYRLKHPDGKKEVVYYDTLTLLGLQNCMSSFHRSGSNKIKHKGYIIIRELNGGVDG